MTPDQWIERSRRAWETADADEVVDLFTPAVCCQSSVFRGPYLGRDAIRQHWQHGAGTQRDITVRMGRPVTTGARVAAEWWTTMTDPDEGEITLPGAPVGAPGSVKIISRSRTGGQVP
jgi:SnoaL-like domain